MRWLLFAHNIKKFKKFMNYCLRRWWTHINLKKKEWKFKSPFSHRSKNHSHKRCVLVGKARIQTSDILRRVPCHFSTSPTWALCGCRWRYLENSSFFVILRKRLLVDEAKNVVKNRSRIRSLANTCLNIRFFSFFLPPKNKFIKGIYRR